MFYINKQRNPSRVSDGAAPERPSVGEAAHRVAQRQPATADGGDVVPAGSHHHGNAGETLLQPRLRPGEGERGVVGSESSCAAYQLSETYFTF